MNIERRKYTPPQVARILAVAPETVIAWIRSGELDAINVAKSTARRPRYRIDIDDLKRFEQRRKVLPTKKTVSRKRKSCPKHVIEFY